MLNCPKCPGKLEEKKVEDVKVDICWACEGIWFDEGELPKVLIADSRDFKKIDVDREDLDGKEFSEVYAELDTKRGKCPRCPDSPVLERAPYTKGVVIDVCPECHGIWLDSGEIHKLRDRTLVNWADKLYSFKSAVVTKLQLLFKKPNRPH